MKLLKHFTWELPQTLLGLLLFTVLAITKQVHSSYGRFVDRKVIRTELNFGVSLGRYIIVHKRTNYKTLMHEYGHCRQSELFGPLYLLLVGLPSITQNILTRARVLRTSNYYNRWPENHADKLGGVRR